MVHLRYLGNFKYLKTLEKTIVYWHEKGWRLVNNKRVFTFCF